MKKNMPINCLVFFVNFLLFESIMMLFLMCNVNIETTEIEQDPIYKVVDEIVEVNVYHQESPIIAISNKGGKELILLDKSGSMKEFVTSLYTNNVEFFKKNDVWTFDTEVHKNISSIDQIEFEGNTNVFQAINIAAEAGYTTVWLCSDLEHNTGNIELNELAKEMQIIVYSPKNLDEQKTIEVIEELKSSNAKVITIN